jgi:hypothetical protein
MNKVAGGSLVLFVGLLFIGCSSFDKELVAKVKQAAVYSISINKQVDISDLTDSNSTGVGLPVGSLASIFTALAQSDKFDLRPLVEKIHGDMFKSYAKSLPFPLVAEDTVLANEEYRLIAKQKTATASYFIAPAGYPVKVLDDSTAKVLAGMFPDIDAFISLGLKFRLEKAHSFGPYASAQIKAYLRFIVLNRDGKTVFQDLESGESDDTIAVVFGGFNADPVPEMCKQAADKALVAFSEWLTKKLAK